MRSLFVIAASLFVSFTLLSAQETAAPGAPKSADHSAVHGCIAGGPGAYTLTSKSGQTYELVGNETLVSKFVGKEVKVAGPKGSASDLSTGMQGHTGEATSNPTGGTAPTLKVSSVTMVSDHCGK